VQVSSTEDVARPDRHQIFHLRSSRCRSVALFFPHLSFLITLALLPACVSNSRVLLLLLPSRASGRAGPAGSSPAHVGWAGPSPKKLKKKRKNKNKNKKNYKV
jgi:hypothetical protein